MEAAVHGANNNFWMVIPYKIAKIIANFLVICYNIHEHQGLLMADRRFLAWLRTVTVEERSMEP
ncbi:hypothetical protein ACTQW9_05145 [Lachnospiraceae bacterium LCP19S3_B12]